MSSLMDEIRADEGYSPTLYVDTMGVLTGGYGHAFHVGSPLSHNMWESIFWDDVYSAIQDYDSLKLSLDEDRKNVIINMVYNLGLPKFLKFKKLIKALRKQDYEQAAFEMKNSKWYKQVGNRSERLIKRMKGVVKWES